VECHGCDDEGSRGMKGEERKKEGKQVTDKMR
jgi:hypothetical protein